MVLSFCALLTAHALAYAPAALQGKELYEALYATGWGKDTRVSQGAKLLHTIRNMRRQGAAIDSVLDVGCSHGNVVAELWQSGIVASIPNMFLCRTRQRRAKRQRKKRQGRERRERDDREVA